MEMANITMVNIRRKENHITIYLPGKRYLLYPQTDTAARTEHPGTKEW